MASVEAVDYISIRKATNGVVVEVYRNSQDGRSEVFVQPPEVYVANSREELLKHLPALLDRMEVK